MRHTRRIILISLIVAAAMLLSLVAACGKRNKDQVNLMTWADFIPSEIIRDFEKDTGITVNYKTVGSNEDMQSLLEASPDQYDLAVVTDYMVDILRVNGDIGKLDKDAMENFGNINPAFQSKYYDENNDYSIPYAVSTAFLLVNPDKVAELGAEPVENYADMWQEELKGQIVLIDWSVEIMGLVLKTLGYNYNETDPAIVAEAKEKLFELRPNVMRFETNTPEDSLVSGEAAVGFMYSNQILKGMEADSKLKPVFPGEGIPMYIDSIVMSHKAPHPEATYKFLDYLMSPEVSAKISELTLFTNTNSKAIDHLSDDFKDNPIINMPDEVASMASFYTNVDAVLEEYGVIYDEFKLR